MCMTLPYPKSQVRCSCFPPLYFFVITLHMQRERGKLIAVGVHIFYIIMYVLLIYLWTKKIESYFNDRLTFSNIMAVGLLVEFID